MLIQGGPHLAVLPCLPPIYKTLGYIYAQATQKVEY